MKTMLLGIAVLVGVGLATSCSSSHFDTELVTLSVPGPIPGCIAVNSAGVYWADTYANTILSAPVGGVPDGGAPTTVASVANPICVAADDTNVYWTGGTTVAKAPLGGGKPTVVAAGQTGLGTIALDATSVYWTALEGDDVNLGVIMKAPLGGGTPTTLATGQLSPTGLSVDGKDIYWANQDGTGSSVMTLSLANHTSPTALVSGQDTI
jgi:hypothetical protein